MTYRLAGRTTPTTGLFELPRLDVEPIDVRRATAAPVTLLRVRLDGADARLILSTGPDGAPSLTLEPHRW